MNQVGQFCTRGLYLEKGAMLVCGDVRQAITAYNTFTREHVRGESHECAGAVVKSYSIKLSSSQIAYGETLDLEIAIESSRAIAAAYILIYLYDLSGAIVAEYNSAQEAVKPRLAPGRNLIRRPFGPLLLRPAQYSLGIWIQEMGSIDPVIWSNGKHSFTVSGKADGFCAYQLR